MTYKRVIVTGGCGFIGSHLCQYLCQQDYHVVNVDKHSYAVMPENLALLDDLKRQGYHYNEVVGDIQDGQLLANVFSQHKPTYVFHLAAESHVDRSIMFPNDHLMSNVVGTYQLLEVTRNYLEGTGLAFGDEFRLVYCSTDEVYGELWHEDPSWTEGSPMRPRSPYSATKACGDLLCNAWKTTYRVPTIVTHCTNNYGPGQFYEKLLPKVIQCLMDGERIPIYGSGNQIRDWLFVSDHCSGLTKAAERGLPGMIYNFSSGDELENLGMVKLIVDEVKQRLNALAAVDFNDLIEHSDLRPTDDLRYSLDNSRARSDLDWSPTVSLKEGIKRTVDYYFER